MWSQGKRREAIEEWNRLPLPLPREQMYGPIREMADRLLDLGYLDVYKELLGDIHPHDFTGVSTPALRRLHDDLAAFLETRKCRYCRGDETAHACECV